MPTTNRKLRVFLCHASQDKPIVRELYQRLLLEGWIDPWLDEENLIPGHDWNMEIEKAVGSADVVVVLLSSKSVNKEGYVQKELNISLNYALYKPEGTIFIIPLRLDDCLVPWRLKHVQYIDYFPFTQIPRAFKRILKAIEKLASEKGVDVYKLREVARKKAEDERKRETVERIKKEAEEKVRREEEDAIRKQAEERTRRYLKRLARQDAERKILKQKKMPTHLDVVSSEKLMKVRQSRLPSRDLDINLSNYDDATIFYYARFTYGNAQLSESLKYYAELIKRKVLVAEVIIDLTNISSLEEKEVMVWLLLADACAQSGDQENSLLYKKIAASLP